MKKALFFLMTLVALLPWAVNAQIPQLNEGFEGTTFPPQDWTPIHVSGAKEWVRTTSYYKTGSASAQMQYATSGHENYLVTPKLVPEDGEALSFYVSAQSYSGTTVTIEVSTTTPTASAFTTTLATYTTGSSTANYIGTSSISTWVQKTISADLLEPYVGQEIYIAFHVVDENGSHVCIDDVTGVSLYVPSCPKPTGLAAVLTPGDGSIATLSWTKGGEETNWVVEYSTASDFTGATQVTSGFITTDAPSISVNLTGLTAEQTYYARVKANCGPGDESDWCSTVCPFTPTDAYTLPLNEGSSTSSYVPFYYYVGSYTTIASQFIIPAADLASIQWATIDKLTFYNSTATVSYGSANFTVYAGEVNTTTQSGSFTDWNSLTAVYTGTVSVSNNEMVITFDQPFQYTTGNLLIGFKINSTGTSASYSDTWKGVSATSGASVYSSYNSSVSTASFLPQVTIGYIPGVAPSCLPPTTPQEVVNTASTNSVQLTWTVGASETAWDIYYTTSSSDIPDENTTPSRVNIPDNPYTLDGLTHSTHYYVYVRANCGDEQSLWSQRGEFATACDAVTTFPWRENFESYTANTNTSYDEAYKVNDPCWLNEHYLDGTGSSGTMTFFQVCSNTQTGNSTNKLQLPDMKSGTQTLLRLPEMTLPSTNYQFVIDFLRNASGTNYTSEGVRVYASTDGEIDGATELGFLYRNCSQTDGNIVTSENSTGWYTYEFPIPFSGTCYIILRGESQYGSASYMDNLVVEQVPTCRKPSALMLETPSSRTAHTATLKWTNGAEGQNAWQIAYKAGSNFDPNDAEALATATIVNVTTNPATIEGLAQSTTYYAYVRANCGTDGYSDWSVANATFTTLAGNVTPTGLAVAANTITSSQATASWNAVAGNTLHQSYDIYWDASNVASVPDEPAAPNLISGITTTSQLLSSLDAETEYKVWVRDNCGTDGLSAWSSAVTFTTASACQTPDGLAANSVTNNSATLSWNAYGQTGFNLQYRVSGEEWDANNIISNVNTPYSMNPILTGNITYQVRVQATCTADPTSDDSWSNVASFTTACDAEPFPWSENFDNWTSKSVCWLFRSGQYNMGAGPATTSSSAWPLNTSYGDYITIDGNALTMNLYSSNRYWAVTPAIDITTNDAVLKVDVAVAAWSSADPNYDNNDTLAFAISTDGGATFTNLRVLDGDDLNDLGNDYTTIYVPVAGYNGQAVRFAIYGGSISGTSPYDNRCVIDNVSVEEAPACYPVGTLAEATDITPFSAKLSWGLIDNTQDGWRITYATNAELTENMHAITVTSHENYTLSGLTPETHYYVAVCAFCGAPGYGAASNIIEFTTGIACQKPTYLAYSNLQQTSVDLSWTENGTASAWKVAYKAEDAADFSETMVLENPYTLGGLTQGTNYTVKVRAICGGDYGNSQWSDEITFMTVASCPAPENLAVTQYSETAHGATITWEGNNENDSYTIEYAEGPMAGVATLLEENFDDSSLPTGWNATTTNWSIGSSNNAGGVANELHFYWDPSTSDSRVITPALDLTGISTVTFAFKHDLHYYSSATAPVALGIATSSDGGTTWNQGWSQSYSANASGTISEVISTPDMGNPNVLFCIYFSGSSYDMDDWYFDDITITTEFTPTYTWNTLQSGVTGNSYTITTLDPETQYVVRVKGVCDENTSPASNIVSFTTTVACPAPTNLANGDPETDQVVLSWKETANANEWQICLNGDCDNPRTVTMSEISSTSYPGVPGVEIYNYILNNLTPGTAYTAKVRANCGNGDGVSEWSNEINFTTLETCGAPTAFTLGTVTAHEASFSWTAGNGNTAWKIYVKKHADAEYPATYTDANIVNATINELDAATTYDVKIVPNCDDTKSLEVENAFTTECDAITITDVYNYEQNFNTPVVTSTYSSTTGLVVPICWENPYTTGSSQAGQPHIIAAPSGNYSYNYSTDQVLNFYGSGNNYVTLPEFTNDLSDLQISFKWATEGSSSSRVLTLGYITAADDGHYSSFTAIGNGYSTTSTSAESYHALKTETAYLNNVPAEATRLVFRWYSSDQYSCNIDDVVVSLAPSCYPVGTLAEATNITATSADLSWTLVDNNQESWRITYATNEGFTENMHAIEVTTHENYTLSGLTPETHYYVAVCATCGAIGDGAGSNVIEFTTPVACDAPTALTLDSRTTTSLTVSWTENGDATSWIVGYKAEGEEDFHDNMNVTENPYTIEGLTDETNYTVRVKSNCSNGYPSPELTGQFQTEASCPAPTGLYTASVTSDGATVRWAAGGDETAWNVQYHAQGENGWTTGSTQGDSTYTFSQLTPNTTYEWQVQAVCSDNNISDWSVSGFFTTLEQTPAEVCKEWVLLTDAGNLTAGDKIIIAAANDNLAMSTTQNTNNRNITAIVKTDNGNKMEEPSNEVQILTLETGIETNTWALNTGSGYLYAASSSSNQLKTKDDVDANASWTITVANGDFTIKAEGSNTRNLMRYNSSNSLISCYGSGQDPLVIYKLADKKATSDTTAVVLADSFEWRGITCPASGDYEVVVGTAANGCDSVRVLHLTLQHKVATPVINPVADTYTEPVNVTITCETEGATIYYTTDGTEPNTQSTAYATEGFTLNETATVKAIAVKAGDEWVNSDVATVNYTINIPLYTVTLDAGNGSLNIPSNTVEGNSLNPIDLSNVTATLDNCDGWNFAGWSTSSVSETTTAPTTFVEELYYPTADVTLYAVYQQTEQSGQVIPARYVKVTSDQNDWSGDYLIVCENANKAFNGNLTTLDASNNNIAVTIDNGIIESNTTTDAAKFIIAKLNTTTGYSIKSASGYYIGSTSNSKNELLSSTSTQYSNTISVNSGNASIQGTSRYLRYNNANNDQRFRYYTSSSQQDIQLYKYEDGTAPATTTYNSNPACVTLYTITATADPTEGGTVSGAGTYDDGTEITLTATANEGYTFVNWTKGGETVSLTPTCTLTVTEAAEYVANFVINSYDITANVAPVNSGTVTGAGTYNYGASATLTATANTGYHFVNWTENGNPVSDDATYQFVVNGARDLVANFAVTSADLAWSADNFTAYTMIDFNNWKPTLNNPNNVSVRYGLVEDVASIVVNPETGYITNNFNVPRIASAGTFHIYAVHETDQTFYYDSVVYTLTVDWAALVAMTKNIDEGGNTTFLNAVEDLTHAYSNNLIAYLAPGAGFTATATANEGYHFVKWQTNNNSDGFMDYASTDTVVYTAPSEITSLYLVSMRAVFDTNTYVLNVVSANETMGIVEGSTTAKHFLSYEISATPNTGYHFTQWSDGNTQNPRTVTLTENTTYTAEFAINNYTITATANPTAGGSVEGAGNYNHFDNATLTATATTGYTFTNWTENGVVVNATNPYEFQVTGERELVANFSLNTYAVSASANPAAGGTVTGAGTYSHGATVTLTATANEGYNFVNWTEGGQEVSTDASYTFTFTEGRTLVANFTPIIYTVTFNPGTGTCQTESLTGSIESSINIDAVTATPEVICGNQDWVFAGWSTASVAETAQAPAFVSGTQYVPTGNITLYAVYKKTVDGEPTSSTASIDFTEQGYTNGQAVTSASIGNNVNVTFSQGTNNNNNAPKYYSNSVVIPAIRCYGGNTFTVTATESSITNITLTFGSGDGSNYISPDNGDYSNGTWTGNENSVVFTISGTSGNRRIAGISVTTSVPTTSAIYNSNPLCYVYAVNVDQNIPHGSVTASQTTDIVAGTEITLIPAMDDGYHFGRWIVTAGNDPVTVENNKFTMPASDVNVSAEFWIDTLTVNVNANPTAGGTVTGAGDYEFGDQVTLTATANTGYTFVNWTVNNQAVSTDATYQFTFDGAAGTRTFVANFSLNSYEITVSANPTNGGTVNGGNTYNHGATAMLTANPSTGYHFVNWTKDNVQVSTDAAYSFTVAEAGAYVANFALNSYTIAATANPTAGGAVSGAGTYNHFDNVTLTATVANGYDFDGWYNGNDQVATSLEYSFEATEDVTLEARFAKRYTITFVPGSHSSSTIEPLQGSSVTAVNIDAVTADPSTLCVAQDWVFAGWSSQAIAETNDAPTTWVSGEYYPTSDITLYAVYTKTEGAGSNTASIDFSDQGYNNAQEISDVAISNNVNVTFSEGTNGNNAPTYYTQGSAIRCYGGNTFTVTTTEATITNIALTFSSGGTNTISANSGTYNTNGTWTGNENSVIFTINGTTGQRRIAGMSVTTFSGTVTYNSDPECFVYDVVVNPDIEHGTVTADPNTGVIAGTEITLTNTPSEGYHFAGWDVTAGNDPVAVENNKFLMPESDVNVSATFEPDTFTLTINYSIVGGGDAPQSYSDRLPFGTPYSVNTPVIAGLTPSQEVVSGTMPAQDVTVNVTYSTVPYTLTIHYVYADNTPAANDVVRNLAYNVPYSETSPTIEGYTPDQAVVSGTMGEADLEVTVVYSINSHNLTINYVNEDASAQVAESHTATLNYHDNYSVVSPQVAGYAANKSVVSGTMGDADKTETVTYYLVETNIVDATNCAGTGTGSLTVTAPTGNFEYSLDGVTFQTETQFANLNAGDYTLYIRPTGEDYNYSGVWTVNSNITMPVAEASVNPFYCLGDEINLSGNGSSTGSEYTYAWSGPNNFTANDIDATITAAEDIHSGSYTLTVTNTVTNCVSDTTIEVIVNTPNMNGYLFTIATHGDAYANLVGGQATPVFATPTVQHYLADAGCTVNVNNDAQATYEEAGDYTITWTATDACGNTATTTQVLHIVLGTCPVATDVDNNTYPVVALNNICWMAANLRTTHYSDGRLIPNPMVYTSVMYPDATANLDMFGYLYDWTAAMDAANGLVQDANGNVQGICPDGWRMPKENEIRALVNDGVSDIFDLRTTDQWLNNFGTNTTGFSLLPAGCYNANSDRFENLHGDAYIWGVGASAPAQPRVFWADCKCYNWQILDTTTPMGYSVRCVRNN